MEGQSSNLPKSVSVIIPVTERPDDASDIHRDYCAVLDGLDIAYELIYVLDGPFPEFRKCLHQVKDSGDDLTIVQLGKHFGESAALEAGFENSKEEWLKMDPAQATLLVNLVAWVHDVEDALTKSHSDPQAMQKALDNQVQLLVNLIKMVQGDRKG